MVELVHPRNIVAILPDMVGTTVCALPAIRALYSAFPDATIRLIGFNPVSEFLLDEPYGDDLTLLDQTRLTAELPGLFPSPPDLVLDMLGTPAGRVALAKVEPRRLVSWPDDDHCVTDPVPLPAGRAQLAVQDYLDFVIAAGAPAPFSSPVLTVAQTTRVCADAWLAERDTSPGETIFVLGVGGGNDRKRWPLQHYLDLEERLQEHGRSLYLLGPREKQLAHQLRMLPERRLVADSLPLSLAKGLVSRARLAVCNDYAMMHIAAALGVPTVGVFLASSPDLWFPYPSPSVAVIGQPLGCRPCYIEDCDQWHCNDPVLPALVHSAVARLLRHEPPSTSSLQ